MTAYSHSRISTFETCPYQYKLKYIDRIKVDTPTTIECFMGDLVHQTLEKLYKDKRFKKRVSKAMLLKFYKDLWEKEYSDDILVAKADQGITAENYKKMGLQYIADYYDKYKPFDQLTILGLETTDRMTLPDGNQWHVRIDKLACDNEGNYYVCDYKTNARMKDQEEADADRQLALYSIWVKDKFKDAKSVKLVWHMLAFNKDAVSERSDEQLEKLQQDVCDKIKEIESTTEFPRNQTGLCNYCVYKGICPSFKHEVELEEKSVEEFKKDDGVKLVDEYSKVKMQLGELKERKGELEGKLIDYAKQLDVDSIFGSNKIAKVKEFDKCLMPEDKEKLIGILKKKGLYDTYSMLCGVRLGSHILKGDVSDKDVCGCVEVVKGFRFSLAKRKDVEE
ncbi:PD-(D/E)XK nuclease family protein [Candidatus Pacearchaeota archaeon]|nr:PD-(D/E)XK nuclease family protein [Candidatus Pacearchaeota archaeon]